MSFKKTKKRKRRFTKRKEKFEEYIQQKYKLFPFKSYARTNKTKNPNQQGTPKMPK